MPAPATTFDIDATTANQRLDVYLTEALPELSRTRVQRLIATGAVAVNGQAARASTRLQDGDVVRVAAATWAPDDLADARPSAGADLPLDVLYADATIIVVNKAAGQVVHPALGHKDDTLVNALLARYPDLTVAFEGRRPGIVHRLDKDTSGVLVAGRTVAAADHLMRQFKDRGVAKTYLALAKGMVTPLAGLIEAPIARDPRHRQRMAALASGRPAETGFQVLASTAEYSWLVLRPRTGRTHQIRVHLAAIGHPVAGDELYGRRDRLAPRLALHAWRLRFVHPATGEQVSFTAPVPDDLLAALAALGITQVLPAAAD